MPAFLCHFHYKKAWSNKLVSLHEPKAKDAARGWEVREQLKAELNAIVKAPSLSTAVAMLDTLLVKWNAEAPNFVKYFKETWGAPSAWSGGC